MRRNTFPPRPRADGARLPAPALPTRKTFKCIVDDTALIAGVKKSTRDGIKKWVSMGAITLFVPLHTLAQLDRLKKGHERINSDAKDAIYWLDEITSASTSRVVLEGGEEVYKTWEEVEKFLLPETLLSMEESDSDVEDYEDLESSFNQLDVSDETSMSSTHSVRDIRPTTPSSPNSACSTTASPRGSKTSAKKAHDSDAVIESPDHTARNSAEYSRDEKASTGAVPGYLQPLFNHILWRIHQETNPDAALENYILLTNDPTKQMIAQRFGIRAKRLEQLRDTVGREDREYKNRLALYKMETGGTPTSLEKISSPVPTNNRLSSTSDQGVEGQESDEEDVILLNRAPRGPQAANKRVFDPNDFGGRANAPPPHRGAPLGPRGRGGRGGRGGYAPRGAYVAPGPVRTQPTPRTDPNQPIDPDSFARPSPRSSTFRGGRRRLWEPN